MECGGATTHKSSIPVSSFLQLKLNSAPTTSSSSFHASSPSAEITNSLVLDVGSDDEPDQ